MTFPERIHELGLAIDRCWAERGYAPTSFSGISSEALRQGGFHQRFNHGQVLDWLSASGTPPTQLEGGLGRPGLTLYHTPRFFIRLEYRLNSLSAIHNHAFRGAMQVLQGQGLYSHHRFQARKRWGTGVLTGDLLQRTVEVLAPGAVREIGTGGETIHQACSVTEPQVVLRVLTTRDPDGEVYRYFPPGLAVLEVPNPAPQEQRLVEMTRYMVQTSHPGLNRFVETVAVEQGDASLFAVLLELRHDSDGRKLVRSLASREGVEGDRGWLCDLASILEGVPLQMELFAQQTRGTGPRFLCTALMMVTDGGALQRLVREHEPVVDVVETLLGWVREGVRQGWGKGGWSGDDERFLRSLLCAEAGSVPPGAVERLRAVTPIRVLLDCWARGERP